MLWLGALILDALFGGRKALGAMPSFDDLSQVSLSFLRKRLERENRSARAHHWRGLISVFVLVPIAIWLGLLLNAMVFWYTATATIAAVILAQVLATKLSWQSAESLARGGDSTARRQAVETLLATYAHSIIPSLLLFLVGGFALLFPYRMLLVADTVAASSGKPSAYLRPFIVARRLFGSPGELLATVFILFSSILMPRAYVLQSVKTLLKTKQKIRHGTTAVVAGAFNMSLQMNGGATKTIWIGPQNGTAKISQEACRHALIVALVAFAVSIAFLLVLLVAATK